MNPLSLINILMHAVAAVPGIQNDIKDAVTKNWNLGLVQDFTQGLDVLHSIVNDVGASFNDPSIDSGLPTPTPPQPSLPGPPIHTPEEIEAAKAVIAAATAAGQTLPQANSVPPL